MFALMSTSAVVVIACVLQTPFATTPSDRTRVPVKVVFKVMGRFVFLFVTQFVVPLVLRASSGTIVQCVGVRVVTPVQGARVFPQLDDHQKQPVVNKGTLPIRANRSRD